VKQPLKKNETGYYKTRNDETPAWSKRKFWRVVADFFSEHPGIYPETERNSSFLTGAFR
jgi:hypothetical protein